MAAAALLACAPTPTMRSDAADTVTYTEDVQPIFAAKCGPCHTTQSQGHHNIAADYAVVNMPIQSPDSFGCWNDVDMTMPKKMGECALILIMNGRMPMSAGCGTPTEDPAVCVSAAEEAIIAAWIAAGMPQ
jgi:hypothetical protein